MATVSTYDHDPRARRAVLAASAGKGRWLLESAVSLLPSWLHGLVCPFCPAVLKDGSKGERHA